VRRHKVGFAATAAIIIILFAGVLISTWQAGRATAALNELRQTAPAFATQAHTLAAAERFDEAIEKLDYAIKLRPDVAEYRMAKGDLLQSQLKLAEAAALYREALHLKPGLAHAEASAQLCDELLAAKPAKGGGLSRESLANLLSAMQQQQRPAAEMFPVARLLGEENKLLLDLWLEKLKDLPIPPDRPIKERLTMADTGRLKLDLAGTSVSDLEALRDMPVGWLDLNGCSGIKSLEPLREAPLRTLWMPGLASLDSDSIAVISSLTHLKVLSLAGTKVADLSPLQGLPLVELDLTDTPVHDISPLRGMPLKILNLRSTRVADLSPLAGMPLTVFDASGIPADDYSPLAGAPLETFMTQNSPIRDLSFLEGSPIQVLALHNCNEALGYAALEGLESLSLLILPDGYRNLPPEELAAIAKLRNSPTLKNIESVGHRSGRGKAFLINTAQTSDEFWKNWDREEAIISYLKESGLNFHLSQLSSGNFRLEVLHQPLRDLSFLENTPVEELRLSGTQISDLRPLEKLPLTVLDIVQTRVSDLSPLSSPVLSASLKELYIWRIPATDFSPIASCTSLEVLDAADTALKDLNIVQSLNLRTLLLAGVEMSDISALAGMPLHWVSLARTDVTDISPLLQCPSLQELVLPPNARDVEALHSLPALSRLSYDEIGMNGHGGHSAQTTEEFWAGRQHGLTAMSVAALSTESIQNPNDTILALKVAALQAWFGLNADYVATCKRELTWGATAVAPIDLERVAKIASLLPVTDPSIQEASLRLARKGWKLGASSAEAPWHSMTLGIAEYRSDHFQAADEALRVAEQAPDSQWTNALIGTAAFYRAMSLFKQGRADEARALFAATEARMSPCPADTDPLPVAVHHDDLIMWLAHREASALIEGTPEITADTK